jgi:predicted enzyme related to lactoylglutathione lyase
MKMAIIQLPARDWQTLVNWYRDILGLKVLVRVEEDGYALLDAGGVQLAVKRNETAETNGLHENGPKLYFAVQNLDEEMKRLGDLGVNILKPMKVTSENYRRAVIADPEGQRICLFDWHKIEDPFATTVA